MTKLSAVMQRSEIRPCFAADFALQKEAVPVRANGYGGRAGGVFFREIQAAMGSGVSVERA